MGEVGEGRYGLASWKLERRYSKSEIELRVSANGPKGYPLYQNMTVK